MSQSSGRPGSSSRRRQKPTTRAATPDDIDTIVSFVRSLAAYENLSDKMVAKPEDYAAAFFTESPRVFCEIGFIGDRPAGIAVWFYSFSTFLGKHGLYLEDIFVDPAQRNLGVGKALLARLAKRCVDEGLGRFEWTVLDWNKSAIGFYAAMGAPLNDGWVPVKMPRDAIEKLARECP